MGDTFCGKFGMGQFCVPFLQGGPCDDGYSILGSMMWPRSPRMVQSGQGSGGFGSLEPINLRIPSMSYLTPKTRLCQLASVRVWGLRLRVNYASLSLNSS